MKVCVVTKLKHEIQMTSCKRMINDAHEWWKSAIREAPMTGGYIVLAHGIEWA